MTNAGPQEEISSRQQADQDAIAVMKRGGEEGVVLESAHLQVEGQKLVGGGEIEVRDNFLLRVLQRQDDGKWLTTMPTGTRHTPAPPDVNEPGDESSGRRPS